MAIKSAGKQELYMQARIVRGAAETWGISIARAAQLFDESDTFRYITDNFDILHVMGDAAILDDVIGYMHSRGVACDAEAS